MKLDDLVKANDLATKWRYLMQLERTLRDAPWMCVTGLSIPANIDNGLNLDDLFHAGFTKDYVNEQIRDLIAQMLDRQASILLSEMEKIDLSTDAPATEREELIRAFDEKEKIRKAG